MSAPRGPFSTQHSAFSIARATRGLSPAVVVPAVVPADESTTDTRSRHAPIRRCIAEERLAANTNDIVGIVLKTEYDISFSPASVISNSFRRVLSVGAHVDTPAFAAAYPRIAWNVSGMFIATEHYTDDVYLSERQKGFNTHVEMGMKWAWDALHEDGWLDVSPTNGPPAGP